MFNPSTDVQAIRIFQFLDDNGSGTVHVSIMDLLVKMLQEQLQFSKASFDFLEQLRTECANNPARTLLEPDFVSFFSTIPSHKVRYELPKGAHWTVFHPSSPNMRLWGLLIIMVSLYFFWCVALTSKDHACPRCCHASYVATGAAVQC
jgi:hypothetical protein